MKTVFFGVFATAAALLTSSVAPVFAAPTVAKPTATPVAIIEDKSIARASRPRQIVIVVADGLSPQLVSFGNDYIRKSLDQDDATAIQTFQSAAKTVGVGADALSSLKSVLTTAQKNGYKTGLVTSEDVTKIAPLFYDIALDKSSTPDVASAIINAKFDFIAGGGRSHFLPKTATGSTRDDSKDLAKTLTAAGGTAYFSVESLTDGESQGRVLALQNDKVLNHPIDVEQENESSFDDLVSLALTNLSSENAPFVLVVHDGFLARALAAKDTPGVAESYRHLDTIIDDLNTRESDGNGEFGIAVLATGATTTPYVTATKPTEVNDTFFIVSNLALSYAGAGNKLRGADADAIADFASDQYKGWKISSSDKAAIIAGTLDPETAIRASYEPAIAIGFKEIASASSLQLLSVPASDKGVNAIVDVVSQTPLASTQPIESIE